VQAMPTVQTQDYGRSVILNGAASHTPPNSLFQRCASALNFAGQLPNALSESP
jgi:hypothetical protein